MDHSAAVGAVRRHFAREDEREWPWPEPDGAGRVSLEVHRRFLRRFVPEGARVLQIGTGPAAFTTELAHRGCRVVVTDRSPTRLHTHEAGLHETAAERCVLRREPLDIACPLPYPDGAFDAVLAYGAPLPRRLDRATEALNGLLRITGGAGVVVASVTSLLGPWRHTPSAVAVPDRAGHDTGPRGGQGRLRYRWSDVVSLVEAAGGTVLSGSASNWTSVGDAGSLLRLEADPQRWQRFLDREVAACAEPGARDGGSHILFAARRASG